MALSNINAPKMARRGRVGEESSTETKDEVCLRLRLCVHVLCIMRVYVHVCGINYLCIAPIHTFGAIDVAWFLLVTIFLLHLATDYQVT